MGYEHRIYVVRKTDQYERSLDKYWAQVKFVFNLGKVYELENIDKFYPATNHFIYDDCCNEILEDEYGKPLTEIPVDELRNVLVKLVSEGVGTMGVKVLLGALEQIKQNDFMFKDLICLHYGY